MGEVIRFSKAKKRLRGLVEERTAAENRTKHGRTKGQKTKEELERQKLRDALDQAKRDDSERS
jgi:hypothetical protein